MASPGRGVLVLVQNLSVPFDRRVWQESQALRDEGYRVVVICPCGVGRDEDRFEVVDGIEIHRYPLGAVTDGLAGYAHEYWLSLWHTHRLVRRVTRSYRFDVVHACNPPDFLLLCALPLRLKGTRFIFDHHDLVPELYLSRFGRGRDVGYRLTRLAERVALSLADVVTTTNESYREVVLGRSRLKPENVFVVRSAPDTTHFQRVDPLPELRRGKRHLLAYVGVMGPQDGVDHALRALADLHTRREDWHAIFVGSGDVFENMRTLSTELGLEDFVEFTGRLPNKQLLQILSTADIGLSPDPKNPLNDVSTMNKILEYMAVGLPVVSYDLVEARVSAGDAAVYADDEESFAVCIDELLDHPDRRQLMAVEGRRRISTELSWERSRAALLAAYERVLGADSVVSPGSSGLAEFPGTAGP